MNALCRNGARNKYLQIFLNSQRQYKTNRTMSKNLGKVVSIAVGAGVLVSATGIILYHYLYGKKYIFVLEKDLNKLSLSLEELRREFEDVRKKRRHGAGDRRERRRGSAVAGEVQLLVPGEWRGSKSAGSSGNHTDGGTSMYSAVESDELDEDEFCDVSDSPAVVSSSSSEAEITEHKRSGKKFRKASNMSLSVTNGEIANFEELDKQLEGNDEQKTKAYNQLLELNDKKPNDWNILWRLARASHAMGGIEGAKGNQKGKQDYYAKGVEYGKQALDLNSNDAKVHKWYAICVGGRSKFLSTKEKIQDGVLYKEHIEKALQLDPSDATLYNLLGRFEFEVSSLSSMERRVASWLFAEVPKGTIEGAIDDFLKAEELNKKPWKENRLLLAKCYIQQSKYAEAVGWLDKALSVPPATSEEKVFDEEIQKLLKKYGSYRSS